MTAPSMAGALEQEGFAHLAAGVEADELFAEAARRTGGDAAVDVTPEAVAEFFADSRLNLGGAQSLELARQWRPELVVTEMHDLVGVLVATTLDVPLATVTTGPVTPPEFLAVIAASAPPPHRGSWRRPRLPGGTLAPGHLPGRPGSVADTEQGGTDHAATAGTPRPGR
ncbi:hypothetical protein ACH40E_31930 [Streptomyces acidicola]|uniref:hypothetical protein n=1 Tax=Streptomyces acidicola TaxID=2596892 RepID=UPI0037B347E6